MPESKAGSAVEEFNRLIKERGERWQQARQPTWLERKHEDFLTISSRYLRSEHTVGKLGQALYHNFCKFMGKPPRSSFATWSRRWKRWYERRPSLKKHSKGYSELPEAHRDAWQKSAQRLTYWIFAIFDRYIKTNCIDKTQFSPEKLKLVEKIRTSELADGDASLIMQILEKKIWIRGQLDTDRR